MNEYLQAVLMILLTIVLYYVSKKIQDKYNNPLLNPALIASIAIIIVLLVCGVSYKGYMKGGTWINHVLNATVVCLAYPLYQNKKKIKKYLTIIFTRRKKGQDEGSHVAAGLSLLPLMYTQYLRTSIPNSI